MYNFIPIDLSWPHRASSLTITSLPVELHISYTAIKINWPRKSTRAEWIGRVYELLSASYPFDFSQHETYSGSRSLDQKKRVILCDNPKDSVTYHQRHPRGRDLQWLHTLSNPISLVLHQSSRPNRQTHKNIPSSGMTVSKASTLIVVLLNLLVLLIFGDGLYGGTLIICWRGLHRLNLLILVISHNCRLEKGPYQSLRLLGVRILYIDLLLHLGPFQFHSR